MRNQGTESTRFAVCTDNTEYAASLEFGKLYQLVDDPEAAKDGYIRVIDESGEDYLYSAHRFFILDVPRALAKVLQTRHGDGVNSGARKLRSVVAPRRRKTLTARRNAK